MIINLLLNVLISLIGVIFKPFDPITVLPTIGGVDIDTQLVTAVGWMNRIFETFWPLEIMMRAFMFIMGYYATKLILKFFLGSRTPGH